jgi:hypothetical protein
MSRIGARLDRLATVWPAEAETPAWVRRMEADAEQSGEGVALLGHLYAMVHRRYQAEHGASPPAGWFDSPAGTEATTADLAELMARLGDVPADDPWWFDALAARLAADPGAAEGWLAEGDRRGWPPLAGQPNDAASFARDVAYFRWSQERLRDCPTLAAWRARTGWAPGAPEDGAWRQRAAARRNKEARR